MRPNRIKTFDWIDIGGSIFADSVGNLNTFSYRPINGTIQKIVKFPSNFTQTGSLLFTVSGTGEPIFNWISGTNQGTVGSLTNINYLFTYANNNAGVTGSPQAYTQRVLNDVVRIIGSGLGAGTSGTGIHIIYI